MLRGSPWSTRLTDLDLIAEHYDDLLRLAGSLKFGHATASLLVGKLSASSRQNTLAAALKDMTGTWRSAGHDRTTSTST